MVDGSCDVNPMLMMVGYLSETSTSFMAIFWKGRIGSDMNTRPLWFVWALRAVVDLWDIEMSIPWVSWKRIFGFCGWKVVVSVVEFYSKVLTCDIL